MKEQEIIKLKMAKRKEKAATKEARAAKTFNSFLEHGRVDTFAKFLLSDDSIRRGMVVKVELIDQDGIEMIYDCSDSKKLAKYKAKFK